MLFVAAVALLPFFVDDFQASQYAYVGIYFIAICGLNILTGYTGQISLGHGAFMAVGGYTTAILAAKAGFPYWTTIPLAGIVAGAAGLLLAIPALRLQRPLPRARDVRPRARRAGADQEVPRPDGRLDRPVLRPRLGARPGSA